MDKGLQKLQSMPCPLQALKKYYKQNSTISSYSRKEHIVFLITLVLGRADTGAV